MNFADFYKQIDPLADRLRQVKSEALATDDLDQLNRLNDESSRLVGGIHDAFNLVIDAKLTRSETSGRSSSPKSGPDSTVLYRLYGGEGLLYIGIAHKVATRLVQHSQSKPWFDEVTSIFVERYRTRAEATEAERLAIIAEQPKFNVVHNGTNPRREKVAGQPAPVRAVAAPCHPLVGKFVHSHADLEHPREARDQGRVTTDLGNGLFLVMWHSWGWGEAMYEQIHHISDMKTWRLFSTADDWRDAGDESMKIVDRRLEREANSTTPFSVVSTPETRG